MGLTGLEIFKLLPKTNCKKCGMPTCLAFAMQLAQKRTSLDKCPDVSEEARQLLAAAAAPPMRLVEFGSGGGSVRVGQETVLFRHEEKFHNPTVVGVTVSDKLSGDSLKARIAAIEALDFERVGTHIKVNAVAVMNDSGSAQAFAAAGDAVKNSTSKALILCSDSADALAAALDKTADVRPLIGTASAENFEAMASVAKSNKCPLIVKAESVEALSELSEKVQELGIEDIVLSLDGLAMRERFYSLTKVRALALKKVFKPLGYPVVSFVCGEEAEQVGCAATLICKYSNIVVLATAAPEALLGLLTVVMNIYTDPQKPVQVESKVYPVGEPDESAPLMFTTNFSLTYYTVESDVEASRVATHILVVDTEGTSVLTAYSGDKLNEKVVSDAMAKNNVDSIVKHRKLIIPGYVAVMSGKLEEATGWEVMVGPRESAMLPKYLREVWQ